MNKLRLTIGALITGLVISQGAVAHGDRGERGLFSDEGRHGHELNFNREALRGLDLSDTQRQEIKAIIEQHRQQNEANRGGLRAARDKLRQLAREDVLDQDAVTDAANDLARLTAQERVAQIRLRHEVKQILNEQQLAVLTSRRNR